MKQLFQGGDPVEFRLINEAYKGLISHITKLEIIEEESKLSNESVIIEVRFPFCLGGHTRVRYIRCIILKLFSR